MKASREIRAMRWLFNRGDARLERVCELAILVDALELVVDIARNRNNPDDELGCAVAAVDALEAKR